MSDWDAAEWSLQLRRAMVEETTPTVRQLRILAGVDIVRRTTDEKYREEILEAAKRTSYKPKDVFIKRTEDVKTEVEVWTGDCLAAGLHLQDTGHNPVVLNMASQVRPGGGWTKGSGAQEENLFRRTSYWASLIPSPEKHDPPLTSPMKVERDWDYPLGEFSTVYSPDVLVLKGAESMGYPLLQKPRKCCFVACACYKHPQCGPGPSFQYPRELRAGVLKKVKSILNTSLLHGHDAVVLSAFGCGAYKNPPNQMALIFKEAIESEEYKNQFKKVVFAIFNDHNAKGEHNPEGNIKPFEDVFGAATLKVPTVL